MHASCGQFLRPPLFYLKEGKLGRPETRGEREREPNVSG